MAIISISNYHSGSKTYFRIMRLPAGYTTIAKSILTNYSGTQQMRIALDFFCTSVHDYSMNFDVFFESLH
jgi:hypothetical protein